MSFEGAILFIVFAYWILSGLNALSGAAESFPLRESTSAAGKIC
jgi:hypothetical protein